MTNTVEQYLTPADLARRYEGKIKVRTWEEMRRKGTGPRFIKLGRKVLYPVAAVLAWENSRTFGSGAEAMRGSTALRNACDSFLSLSNSAA